MSSAWLILCGALVMFMHAGFAMLETGCCRAKNASNVLMKNLVNVCIGTLGWWGIGYGFAYGMGDDVPDEDAGGNGFIGLNGFFAHDYLVQTPTGNAPTGTPLAWFFQWAFCTVAATIVSGAVAERVISSTYSWYVLIMTGFIYPVVVAWTWGYGWIMALFDVGVIDFAGSGIVHLTGGVSGLAGTIVLGPRKGRWENPDEFDAHNLPLVVLGTFILWFGWYGFNCGSTLGMDEGTGYLAAQVAMCTTLAAATGGIVVFFLRYAVYRYYDVGGLCNGILAGLVSITAPCGNVEAGSAVVIGLIGGLVYQMASMLLRKLKIDDPVDAVPVHGACGIWGVLAAVIFDYGSTRWDEPFEQFHGWSGFACMLADDGTCADDLVGDAFLAHLIMIGVIIAWSGVLSGLVFAVLRLTGMLRIDPDTEDMGMDAKKHSPSKAYAMEATPTADRNDTEAI
jgi:Amt family ammonium transporter